MTYRNLVELHRNQSERLGPRIAVRYKRHGLYHDLSWRDYLEQVQACAAALVEAGIKPGDRVGLVAENRVEWLIADMGLMAAGAINVPPHAPLTAKQIHFQLEEAEVRWVFVSTAEQFEKIRKVRTQLPSLQGVVVFDRVPGDDAHSWPGFLQRGRQALAKQRSELQRREAALGPDDLATIMYTSGTTGNPKGVMLTHSNLLTNAAATDAASPRKMEDILLNWLPFSHIYARTVDHYLSIVSGVTLCLAESADTVVANLAEIQPTHLSSVPRLYEKVLAAVSALPTEMKHKQLRTIFGPRIDWLSSGGAPLPVSVAKAFHEAGILLLQGYGLTESSPVITFNRKTRYKLETVGQAIPGVEVAISSDGEVVSRGPHIMKGYWKNPQATAESIRDGWLHTGDLGKLDDEGFLTITGRKKELLVLSNGKKVVPNFIEGLLLSISCIDQAVIHGEGRNFLTALIVPNWPNLRKALPEIKEPSEDALAQHPAVRDLFAKLINDTLADVASWEQIKKFVILPRPFSVAGDELTVSLKLRRNVIFEKYKRDLDALY